MIGIIVILAISGYEIICNHLESGSTVPANIRKKRLISVLCCCHYFIKDMLLLLSQLFESDKTVMWM